MYGRNLNVAYGKSGRQNRTSPYVPIFSRTPARMTLPAVGACTCASGSQVCSGKIGTLMAKLSAKARNIQVWIATGIPGAIGIEPQQVGREHTAGLQ